MTRTLRLKPGDIVLDLGCGKGPTSIFLAKHFNVKVVAVDLWTSATFLNDKFTARGYRDRIVPLNLDVTQRIALRRKLLRRDLLPEFVQLLRRQRGICAALCSTHLKPGGQLCLGSEVLSDEFTAEQLQHPPHVYAFQLPPPNEHVNVFEGDFKKQHTPAWWRDLFEQVRSCTWNTAPNWTTPARSMKSWCATSTSTISIRSTSIFACSRLNGAARIDRARRCSY